MPKDNQSLLEQLTEIAAKLDHRDATGPVNYDNLWDYFLVVNRKKRLIPFWKDDKVIGYVESWRVNKEQFGRIILGEVIDIGVEDISTGSICYLNNVWIDPEFRRTGIYKVLKTAFFKQNFMCDYFCGTARRKKSEPVKVFKRQQFYDKYMKRGEDNVRKQRTRNNGS